MMNVFVMAVVMVLNENVALFPIVVVFFLNIYL